jgi:hypothetical protein
LLQRVHGCLPHLSTVAKHPNHLRPPSLRR